MKMKVKKGNLTGAIIGFVLALTLFFVLIVIQREMLKETEKTVAILARKPIVAGTVITEKNASEYLKEVEISSTLATKETFGSVSELIGKYVTRNTAEDEILYRGLLEDEAEVLSRFKNPVELSLSLSEETAAVAGTIRKGDYVNVYAYRRNSGGATLYELVLENVLVNNAYDSATTKIEMSDTKTVALTFTFYLEQADVPGLLDKLETKDIFVVKVK
jgi:Flp pilus assembly protein CpaB